MRVVVKKSANEKGVVVFWVLRSCFARYFSVSSHYEVYFVPSVSKSLFLLVSSFQQFKYLLLKLFPSRLSRLSLRLRSIGPSLFGLTSLSPGYLAITDLMTLSSTSEAVEVSFLHVIS